MRQILTIIILQISFNAFGQSIGDTKIILTLTDTVDIYRKVKIALVKNDFIVKDDGNKDTLQTYPREFTNIQGASVAVAVLNGNTVTLSGVYGLKRIDDWGYTTAAKNYKRILYYRGSKSWKLLMRVADTIGGQISYGR